jgi:hypothetical protein
MSRPLDRELSDTDDLEFNNGTQTLPNDTFNNNLSARPKSTSEEVDVDSEASIEDQVDFGEMNLEDAKTSGYVGEDGQAVSKARTDVMGSPTGAYTDIGAGRSSAVHPSHPSKDKHH